MARTPPSLLGTDRRIVYAHKKYHSGLMWSGVERGFAGIKFSGSVSKNGKRRVIVERIKNKIKKPSVSFTVWYG